jgi:hypothetical protein
MKPSSLLTLAALLGIFPACVSAETILNKCTDGIQITYTDKPCEKLGLKDGGTIKNTVTIISTTPIFQVPLKVHKNDNSGAAATIKPLLDKSLN